MPDAKVALIFDPDFEIVKDFMCGRCQGRNKTCLCVSPDFHSEAICKDCLLQVIEEIDRVTGTPDPASSDRG